MVPNYTSSRDGISRRKLLASTAVIGASALAGCSASASSDSIDCSTKAVERGDGEIFQQAATMIDEDSVVLLVTLHDPADTLPIESIHIRDSDGELVNEIPTTDAREYRITLGSPPHHGRLTLSAENDQRTEIDSLEFEYHCTNT